jgi:hypothetical protein
MVAKWGRSQAKAVKGVVTQARAIRTNILTAAFAASLLVLLGKTVFIIKILLLSYVAIL